MKKSLILVLMLLALLFVGVGLALADEIEWEDVKDLPISAEQEKDSYPLLRQVMNGAFIDDEDMSTELLKTLSDALPLLAALPAEDLASFAAAYNLPVEAVTESYYDALIDTLRANITLNPDESNEAQSILKLLLSDEDEDAPKEAPTPEALESAMASYNLPTGFLDYLQNRDADVEDEDKDDADVEDDDDQDAEDKDEADLEDDDDRDAEDKDEADIKDDDDKDAEDKDEADIKDDDDKDTEDKDAAEIEDDGRDDEDKDAAEIEDDDRDDEDKDSEHHRDSGSHSDGENHGDRDDEGDHEDNDD